MVEEIVQHHAQPLLCANPKPQPIIVAPPCAQTGSTAPASAHTKAVMIPTVLARNSRAQTIRVTAHVTHGFISPKLIFCLVIWVFFV